MPLSIEDMKIYLRVDADNEYSLIEAQMSAADKYISGKLSKTQVYLSTGEDGVKVYGPLAEDVLYQQCIKLMVAHWYENREIVTAVASTGIQHTVDAILTHIEGCGDYV